MEVHPRIIIRWVQICDTLTRLSPHIWRPGAGIGLCGEGCCIVTRVCHKGLQVPCVFIRLLEPAFAHLRTLGTITTGICYIDDSILLASPYDELLDHSA